MPWFARVAGLLNPGRLLVAAALALGLSAPLARGAESAARGRGTPRLELRNGDRIVFLGDTFFEREGTYGEFEASLTTAFPDREVTYRNLAWAADTPMGRSRASFDWNKPKEEWLKRVMEQVTLVKPTGAFLSYGMTAALDAAEATGSSPEAGAAALAVFESEMVALLDALEAAGLGPDRVVLLGPISSTAAANVIRALPGLNDSLVKVNDLLRRLADRRGSQFVELMFAENIMSDLSIARREANGIHPNARGLRFFGRVTAGQLGGEAFLGERDDAAREILRAAIERKNEQFFHRWRPANWTYLFGFRKHEQGQNAVEVPKFEPLVEEWDARIAKLRDLRRQDPATVSEVREGALVKAAASGAREGKSAEQPTPRFDVHEGFEVTLWAEDPQLFKPIQINWDPDGRLWVASSRVYPQIRPGQAAEDAILVLEDADGDGRAEKSTVFAEGLLIPTGVVPDGKGGCYVGASHELLHFADTDGDGRADKRTVVLSSFGTEDTHHNLHTLRWGYDGRLYMNQSIYTHTHIETPGGVRRLNSGGIWRFDPETWQLEVFTKGACNPWGHHWDAYGNQFFTDGAGFKGIYQAMEGATYFTYADMRREAPSISPGSYPKFCSLEIVRSPAFPEDWQGQALTCDFRAHRIARFGFRDAGSLMQTVEKADLLRSTNVTFRPIDLRFGPDGALYIADWSNPIIQHGEVDFRDPRRDKEHGRIWRVTAKPGAAGRAKANLTSLGIEQLLDRTLSANGWDQEQARRLLKLRDRKAVLAVVEKWASAQSDPRAALEALWIHEALGSPAPDLVEKLSRSEDAALRVAAARHLTRE